MKQLTNLDAAFIYLENDNAPMQVGCVLVFKQPKNSPMNFDRFTDYMHQRMQTSPIFRRKMLRTPLDLDLPYWVDDVEFDIYSHLSCKRVNTVVREKNNEVQPQVSDELRVQSEAFFATKLHKGIPLWQMQYIESVSDDGHFALLMKVHHAAIDGIAGEEILLGLLDFTEKPRHMPEDTWHPEKEPAFQDVIKTSMKKLKGEPEKLWKLASFFGKKAAASVSLRWREGSNAPPLFFNSPTSLFNQPIESDRVFVTTTVCLNQVKKIKNTFEGHTVNDVILAVCSGAIRQYLTAKGALPEESLTALVPVSLRKEVTQDNKNGNSVSGMCVMLATEEPDPIKRLQSIHDQSLLAKKHNKMVAPEEMLDLAPALPTGYILKSFHDFHTERFLKKIFNVVITNVPGSPMPLYLDGAHLVAQSFMAPIYDYNGLTIAVTSYQGALSFSITSSRAILPDADQMLEHVQSAFRELYNAANEYQVISVNKVPRAVA